MLSTPIGVFGVKSMTPYNLDTGLPFGMARVIGTINIASTVELIDLNGGSSLDPWASERGLRDSAVSLTLREYPHFLWELLAGSVSVATAAEALGAVKALSNVKGTTALSATIGIATATVKAASEADLKYAHYMVKVVTATTVDVFAMSDIDFAQGTFHDFEDDALKITATPLTITMGAAVTIPDFGVELTGGSGTIAMVVDDTAHFQVRPGNNGSNLVQIGTKDERFINFGAIMHAERKSDNRMFMFNFYKLAAAGQPFNMAEKAWSEYETTLKPQKAIPVITAAATALEGLYEYQTLESKNLT